MANIKISQLPVLATPTDVTIVPVVDTGTNKTVTASSLASYVHTKIPVASTTVRGGVKIDGATITSNGSGQLVANYTNYSLPTASTTILGGVKIDGSTITLNGSNQLVANYTTYSLPTASTTILGGVKIDGSTITINGSGVISSSGGSVYTLPTATTSVLGGVKVDGSTITISGSGVISSSSAYSLPIASTSVLGGVKIDGSTITLNGSNQLVANYTTYTLPATTTSALGGVIIPVVGTSGITNTSGTIGLATASTSQLGGVKVDGSTITINGSGVIAASGAGAVVYKGTWNASTNTPTLANGVGTAGWQYAVSVSGTTNFGAGNITFTVGDFVLYSGTVWQQIAAGGIAAAGTLTGTALASNVVTSSLTTVGTLANLTVTNTITGSVSGNAGTVTSISGNTLTSGQVTTALGFTPGTAYSLPTASTTVLGGVKVDGSTVTINGSGVITANYTTYSLPTASTTVLGGVKIDGSTITISGAGVINANYTTYSLPTASSSVLGGVKVGTGLAIDGAGVLSASGPTYAAITTLVVTTPVFNYNIDQYSGDNPAIYAISGTTIAFNLQVGSSHPFLIQNNTGGGFANYTTGLIHVSTSGVVSTGSAAQGQTSGTLYWKIPISVSGTFRYICQNHSSMVGSITVSPKDNIGYLNIPQNSQSAAYTLTLADSGKHIFHPSTDANARTYTIPANSSVAYPIGTALAFINMTSQVVTIAIDTDTMYLSGTGTTGSRSLAQYGSASAIKITATSWLISGSGLT
jgi:plastocyanin